MKTKKLILTAFFTAMMMLGAFIKIPMMPVPVTLQSVFVILSGAVLGARYGALSVILYIGFGLLGLPVFSGGGGVSYIFHPTFGFLIGFILSAFLMGLLIKVSKRPTVIKLSLFALVSIFPTYVIAMLYYCLISKFYLSQTISTAFILYNFFLVFIPADIVKGILIGFLSDKILKNMRLGGIDR